MILPKNGFKSLTWDWRHQSVVDCKVLSTLPADGSSKFLDLDRVLSLTDQICTYRKLSSKYETECSTFISMFFNM